MRHQRKGRKLGRKRDQRKALLKILAANLILKERVVTTEAKAKEVRSLVEKLITRSRSIREENNLHNIRYLVRYLPEEARKKIINEIGPRYQERNGGYTRITKLPPRKTDGAPMAIIELVK
jgi:large subunit ribosomal protein L17